ncbi:hypothetical protein PGQ11_002857 [Apiospora arundinis]|uniref:Uncharacterized protein n=1 Tax=Apiospora arundinis TaxID=335852 RepID=A0ABR2J3C4_9PEZI
MHAIQLSFYKHATMLWARKSLWLAEWIPFRQFALASVAPSRDSRRPPVSSIVLKPLLAFLDFEIPAQNLDQVVDIVKLALALSQLGAANLVVKAAQRADSYLRIAYPTLSDNMPGAAACSTANGDDLRSVVSPSHYITSSMLLAARFHSWLIPLVTLHLTRRG